MSRARRCVAVDLGAESGRVVVGTYDGSGLQTEIVHRFPNVPRQRDGALRWDFQALWEQVQAGLGSAAQAGAIDSVGVDTWGIDYGYLDEQGQIVGDPVHHRDPRTRGAFGVARERVGSRLYRETGTQVMHINTVFQLLAETREGTRPAGARTLLMVPDLFHHVLSGARVAEFTAVSNRPARRPGHTDGRAAGGRRRRHGPRAAPPGRRRLRSGAAGRPRDHPGQPRHRKRRRGGAAGG
jgi:rhamnulokinase